MAIYRGVSGVNRKITNIYRGSNGINREIQEQIRGVNGVNRIVHQAVWEGFMYHLSYDISNTSRLTDSMVELKFAYYDRSVPYIMLYPPETVTIESLNIVGFQSYNYQTSPNKTKYMNVRVLTTGDLGETSYSFYYEDSNKKTRRSLECVGNIGDTINPISNCIRIQCFGEMHRNESNAVCAAIEIPNKSIILNGRPIDFTKMTVK